MHSCELHNEWSNMPVFLPRCMLVVLSSAAARLPHCTPLLTFTASRSGSGPSQVIARICLTRSEFERVLNSVLDLFTEDRRLLEVRGSLIVRRLCVLLNARTIYMTLAAVLQG